MFLLTIVSALAAEAPPPVPGADSAWQMALPALESIDDPMGVEAVFEQYGVDTAQTDLLSAERYGMTYASRRIRVSRRNLGDGTVSERVTLRPTRGCTPLRDGAWSGAALRVHATLGRGEAEPEAPSLLLVGDNPDIGSLVVLVPGDSVETRTVRQNGHLLSEAVRVRRNSDVLELRRNGDKQLICSTSAAASSTGTQKAP